MTAVNQSRSLTAVPRFSLRPALLVPVLAVAFAAYEARNFAGVPAVDRDPATYVREAEEEGQEPVSGSLSIGSLKRG